MKALETLLAAIRRAVLRRCQRILPFSQDAEDAAQDALLGSGPWDLRVHPESRFTTWLYPVVARSAFATYRRLRDAAAPFEVNDQTLVDPRRVSVLAGARVDVTEALEQLRADKPHVVEVIILRDLMGMDYAEIVSRVDVPVGTVKSPSTTVELPCGIY